MTTLQIILLVASAYFALEIYKHIQTLQDPNNEKEEFIDLDEVEKKRI